MNKELKELKKNRKSLKRFILSFKYCYQGMAYAFYHEQNIIVMMVIGIITLALGIVFKLELSERLAIIITVGLVLSLEMVNTALEAVVDLVTKDKKPLAKVAKDAASGAVGIMCIFAVIEGLMIFVPKFIMLFKGM
jgi:Diacylglycerol kinase